MKLPLVSIALIAVTLHRPMELVKRIADASRWDPVLAVAVVEVESQFYPRAERKYKDGSSDYGLWQLNSNWHPQYRGDLAKHTRYGSGYLLGLLIAYRKGGTGATAAALSHYNHGDQYNGIWYAVRVLAVMDKIKPALMIGGR